MEGVEVSEQNKYWKNRKILITGHEGFFGSWLAKTLLGYRARVIGVDKVAHRPISILNDLRKDMVCIKGDIVNLSLVKNIIQSYRPRYVIHAAAEAIVEEAHKNPIRTFQSNIEGTWNILEAARTHKCIKCVIVASSDKAYGGYKKLPYKESYPLSGCHPYDVSKSCADLLAHTYFNSYRFPVCITRCGNIYGPGDFNLSRIVPDAVRLALQGDTLLIRSDGKFTRDYIYIEDVVQGYLILAQKMEALRLAGEAFNFSNGKPISVLDLMRTIYRLIGKKPKYKILNSAHYEIRDQYLSANKARRLLGWRPKYSLYKGLIETITWYKENCYKEDEYD